MEKLLELEKGLEVTATNIPDLLVIDLPTGSLARKKWHQEKLDAFGPPIIDLIENTHFIDAKQANLPDIRADSDRYLFVETGRVFGSYIDQREGESFGRTYMTEINPSKALFVPRGVGCSFQTLDGGDDTIYSYAALDDRSPEIALPLST